jgi:hypothetical protein
MAEKRSWLKITAEYSYRSISLRSTSLKLSWIRCCFGPQFFSRTSPISPEFVFSRIVESACGVLFRRIRSIQIALCPAVRRKGHGHAAPIFEDLVPARSPTIGNPTWAGMAQATEAKHLHPRRFLGAVSAGSLPKAMFGEFGRAPDIYLASSDVSQHSITRDELL